MKLKVLSIRTAIIFIAVIGVILLWNIVKIFVGESGAAGRISILRNTYQKAGPEIAATFTNSLIQKFPFSGNIGWRLQYIKDPMIFLMGKIDTNGLHQFIIDNPSTRFFWSGVGENGKNYSGEGWPDALEYPTTTWTNISFRWPDLEASNIEKYPAVIEGQLNLVSNTALIISH